MLTIELPDSIAQALVAPGGTDLPRKVLEALAIEGFREKRLSQFQVGRVPGLSRIETEDLPAHHADLYDYDPDDLQREASGLAALRLGDRRK